MSHFLKDYFTFSRSERRGLLVLACLMVIVLFLPTIYFKIFPGKEYTLDDILIKHDHNEEISEQTGRMDSVQLFDFNPNKISKDEWLKLGVSEDLVETILNYREAGGQFYDKMDLLRIYGISKDQFLRLEPYIKIKKSYDRYGSYDNLPKEHEKVIIDINEADSAEWTKLYGIGPTYASRIVKYREIMHGFDSLESVQDVYGIKGKVFEQIKSHLVWKESSFVKNFPESKRQTERKPAASLLELNAIDSASLTRISGIGPVYASRIVKYRGLIGGYADKNQLMEVYGFDAKLFKNVAPKVTVDPEKVRKININNDSASELAAHPYISTAMAGFIIKSRINKPFTKPEDLLDSYLFNKELVKKLWPYLEF